MSETKDYDTRRKEAAAMVDFFDPDGAWSKAHAEQSTWTDEQWAAHDAKVAAEREAERKASDEKRAKRERANFLLQFPLRALEAAEVADLNAPAMNALGRWDREKQTVCVLSGAPGVGKTVAATWWAWNFARHARFLRATSFAASSRYDRERRDEWFSANALVLDDLGAEYSDSKGNFLVDLDELVDVFYADKRVLLVTTNCTAEDFKTRYGERVTDRLRESGLWLSVKGSSMRKKP